MNDEQIFKQCEDSPRTKYRNENRVPSFLNFSFENTFISNANVWNTQISLTQYQRSPDTSQMDIDISMDSDNELCRHTWTKLNLKSDSRNSTPRLFEKISENSLEPMDVDESLHSKLKEEEYEKSSESEQSSICSEIEDKEKFTSCCTWFIVLLLPISLAFTALLLFHLKHTSNEEEIFDLDSLEYDLNHKLYGQEIARKHLLNLIGNINKTEIYFLVGTSGVGKTYTTNILAKHFTRKNNIIKYFSIFQENAKDLCDDLSKTEYNLIIFDSIQKLDDLNRLILFLNSNELEIYLSVVFCVITEAQIKPLSTKPVVSNEISLNSVNNLIQTIHRPAHLIHFNDLNIDSIKKCVIDSLLSRNMSVSQQNIDQVIFSLGNLITGCKRVDKKVALLESNN